MCVYFIFYSIFNLLIYLLFNIFKVIMQNIFNMQKFIQDIDEADREIY